MHAVAAKDGFPYAQFARLEVILPKVAAKDQARKTLQLYDLVFNVFTRNATNTVTKVGYVKIRPSDVWGFENDPEWHPIRGLVHQETKFSKSAGFLQLSVKFGPVELEEKFLLQKRKLRVEYGSLANELFPYEIRAYVYQARNLPTSDEATGLLSCAVEMNLAWVGQLLGTVIGRIRFPTELATRKFWPKRARPRWIKFIKNDATTGRMDPTQTDVYLPTGDYYGGDLLVKLEVVPQEYADRKPWYNRHRWPKLQHAKLSIATVGLRNLVSLATKYGDDDSAVVVDDVGDSLGFLELSVPLFPDMHDDEISEPESLDSDEKRELAEYKLYEDEANYSIGDRDTVLGDEQYFDDDMSGDNEDEDDGGENGEKRRIMEVFPEHVAKNSTCGDFAVFRISLSTEAQVDEIKADLEQGTLAVQQQHLNKLYVDLVQERAFTFFKLVQMDINYPDDGFYAPSLTVRLITKGTKGWFSSAPAKEAVFGSCVIPLRPYASDDRAEKPVDKVFHLPKVALSQSGKDQFEAIARRDSDFTNNPFWSYWTIEALLTDDALNSIFAVEVNSQNFKTNNNRRDFHSSIGGKGMGNGDKDDEDENGEEDNGDEEDLAKMEAEDAALGVSNKQIVAASVESNLEDDPKALVPKPFECFELKRGSKVNQNERVVGHFKAVIQVAQLTSVLEEEEGRIMYQTDEYDVDEAKEVKEFVDGEGGNLALSTYLNGGFYRFEEELQLSKANTIYPIHDLLTKGAQMMKVRVYIVQANLLWSPDPLACKPFVKLQLAAPKRSLETLEGFTYAIDDSFNRKEGTSPFIGTMYELDFRFPDVTQLQIRLYDSAPLFGAQLIGSTKIDLEDRWFNPKWQVMKKKKTFFREFRNLTIPSSVIPRGSLEMWIEIYRGNDGNWKPAQYQSTDTHWWVSDGLGSFNWRKKFSLEVPCRFPRLTFKVWQTELITLIPDEVVGQATVDIDFLAAICNAWEGDEPYERPRMMVHLHRIVERHLGENWMSNLFGRKRVAEADPVGLAREPPTRIHFFSSLPKTSILLGHVLCGGGWYYRVFCSFWYWPLSGFIAVFASCLPCPLSRII
ncbi:hypothetical protein BASA81_002505 [Batrachochytrium salamandrivorans]|nr:hypothetical protein BASA81_002505 [Batrachochytrium salamandrivorans]